MKKQRLRGSMRCPMLHVWYWIQVSTSISHMALIFIIFIFGCFFLDSRRLSRSCVKFQIMKYVQFVNFIKIKSSQNKDIYMPVWHADGGRSNAVASIITCWWSLTGGWFTTKWWQGGVDSHITEFEITGTSTQPKVGTRIRTWLREGGQHNTDHMTY